MPTPTFFGQNQMPTSGGSFVPTDIASLDWWLTAESLALSDNAAVVDWLDSSSAGRHYGQNTVDSQPIYKTGIVNGHPVVRFNSNRLIGPDPTARTYTTANTLIIVCSPSSGQGYILVGSGSQGTPAIISAFSSKAFEYFNTNSERATFATTASGFHILAITRTDDAGNYVGYFDGTQVFSSAADASLDWSGKSINQVGRFNSGSDNYTGDVAQVLHFSAILTSAELNNVHSYLGSLYGITVATIP
jgi:hypothetical protein